MISILLATYNGQNYLSPQLESILKQSVKDFKVIISDDGSTDDTLQIINNYKNSYPDQIVILPPRSQGPKGPKGNFDYLLQNCPASDYIFLADQDDVWFPSKLALSLKKMSAMEQQFGADVPILVHTAQTVTDSRLEPLKPTLSALSPRQKAAANSLNSLLLQNVVTGCSAMINRPLFNLYKPLNEAIIMHDWWLALIAASFGHIGFVDEPTMYYRQHGKNCVGGHYKMNGSKFLNLPKKFAKDVSSAQKQAQEFFSCYQDLLPSHEKELITAFISLSNRNIFGKYRQLCQFHLFSTQFIKNCELLLLLPWV